MASSEDILSVLGTGRGIRILLYIRDHEGCLKSGIYREASHNRTLDAKLGELESLGLISRETVSRATRFSLTEKGTRAVELLDGIAGLIDGRRPLTGRSRGSHAASPCSL